MMNTGVSQIALYGHDETSLYGAAAMLDIERIPYRRITDLAALQEDDVLLATGDLERSEADLVARRPAVVLNGGVHFAEKAFGRRATVVRTQPVVMSLDPQLWPLALATRLRRLNRPALSIPMAPACQMAPDGNGVPAGMLLTPVSCQAAMLYQDKCVWSPLDLGAAFAHLMTESYVPDSGEVFASMPLQRTVESFYYGLPAWMRRRVQELSYRRAKLGMGAGWQVADYPVDDSGNILIELLKGLLELAGVRLVHISRWPSPYRSAALMTHDIEPSRYAYRVGLRRLMEQQGPSDHPVVGLVMEPALKHLEGDVLSHLSRFDILCHGLTHLGEGVSDWRTMMQALGETRSRLENMVGRRIRGYRSPRLCRSLDLLRALDASGFEYDSSYPDTDRETLSRYGAGVRLNIPYRPPIESLCGKLRPSRCLELPLAAPDCVQPLFAGQSIEALQEAVRAKADFVRATGGLHVALVHAGVFDDDDAALRERHRLFVAHELNAAGTWMPRLSELLEWWRGRENLTIVWRRGKAFVRNAGNRTAHQVRVVVEDESGNRDLAVPPIEAGATVPLSSSSNTKPRVTEMVLQ